MISNLDEGGDRLCTLQAVPIGKDLPATDWSPASVKGVDGAEEGNKAISKMKVGSSDNIAPQIVQMEENSV